MLTIQLPDDLKEYVLRLQGEIKVQKKLGKYSQASTIIAIIREHRELSAKQLNGTMRAS